VFNDLILQFSARKELIKGASTKLLSTGSQMSFFLAGCCDFLGNDPSVCDLTTTFGTSVKETECARLNQQINGQCKKKRDTG
jgi:hypothetical protein